jgi:Tfp pilus assembly protein PilO
VKFKRKQLIACIALGVLGVVVAIAGLLAVVAPQRSQASKLEVQIAKTETKLISLHGRHGGPVIRAAELFQLARAMPDNADMPGIVLGLARAANASSVTLVSIQPAAVVPQPDGAAALPVRVVVDGQWGGVTSFLRALRTAVTVHGGKLTASDRLFVVDSVQIAAGTGTSEVEATISANAFSYGVAPPPVPTDTTSTTTTTTTTTTTAGGAEAAGAAGSAG